MKQRIISIIVQNPEYKFACSRISKRSELTDDLYQELILAIMDMEEMKLIYLYENEEKNSSLSKYIIGMICRLWYSPRSPLNIKFKKHTSHEVEFSEVFSEFGNCDNYNEQIDIAANSVTALLQSMKSERGDFFNTKVFELYMNNSQSARKVSALTGIPRSTIQDAVDRIKNKIKEKIKPDEL